MKNKFNRKELGEFTCESGTLVISDPCYELNTWCSGQLENCKKGIWRAIAGYSDDEGRISSLICYHSDIKLNENDLRNRAKFTVGVDSGQAGAFDLKYYNDSTIIPKDFIFEYKDYYYPHNNSNNESVPVMSKWNDEDWYGMCCVTTLGVDHQAGVIPFGVVSRSGWGDGSYDCKYQTKNGEIVAIIINYMEYDEEE
jgi:hypothetical protein